MAIDLHVEAGQEYIRPSTVAKMMDVSVDTVLTMARDGDLEGVRFGSQIRILVKSLNMYLETHRLHQEQASGNASTGTVVTLSPESGVQS